MNITKKIVAIVTSLTVFVWLAGPGVAQGITVAELQAQIGAIMAQIATLQSQLAALQQPSSGTPVACSGITFSRSLKQDISGNDVKCLQAILNQSTDTQIAASGAGSPGNETTYFGSLTKAAVVKFQVKYAADILTPIGLTAGTGLVGAKTIAKLNTMTGGVPAGCSCTSWVTGACASGVNAGKKQQTRTCAPVACAVETQYVTDATCAVGGENKVSLAADTPAAATVAKGAKDVIFAKINFCAASEANTVSKIVLKRGGIAADADLSAVKLYEGSTQVGSTQALNTTDHTASFASLNWTIAANSCKVLTIKATIATAATQGDTVKLAIDSASGITSTIALDGVFPISSNGMTVAGISAGTLEISTTTPSGGTAIAGGVDLDIAGFTFTASATEAVNVHTVIVTQAGSAVPSDITNIKLFYGSTQFGSTVAALTSSGKATIDMSSNPLAILAGGSKNIKVVATIGSSLGIQDRTVDFEIADETDVTAYGSNSGGSLQIYSSTQGSVWPQKSYTPVDIVLGGLTVDSSTEYSPSAQDYAKGSSQNSIMAFKFTTGANEAVRITQLKLKEASSTADTDVNNVTLYDAVTGEQLKDTAGNLVPAASMISGFVTFGSYTSGLDTTGLLDIPKSTTKYILVKADVPTGATAANNFLGFIINNPTTDIRADGLSSQNDLKSTDINGGTTTQKPAAASEILHDIISKGVLTVQASANTPGAATYSPGASDFWFAYFDLVSTGEDITVSQLNIHFETSSTATATSSPALSSDINNVRIYEGDSTIPLKTDDTISSGKAEFGINLTVPKNTTKIVKVKADIPSTSISGTSYLRAQVILEEDLTVSGYSSGQAIYATAASWPVYGSLMSSGAPQVDVKAGATPAAQTFVKNTTDAKFTSLFLTASTTEDVKVTKIRVTVNATSTATVADLDGLVALVANYEALDELVSNVKLFDGATQVGSTVTSLTNGTYYWYADFTSLNLTVPKGTTKVIDVKAKILNNTSSVYVFMGVASTSGDVVGNGVVSGTAATKTNAGDAVGKGMTLGSSGALTINQDPDMPASAEILAGTTANMGKWKFTASYEDIEIKKLAFDVFHSYAEVGTSTSYSSPDTSIDDIADPKIQISINNVATSTVLSISQLNQPATYSEMSTLELTAAPHASSGPGAVITISSGGSGVEPYIVCATTSNGVQSTTTVIGATTTISDTDGYQIDLQIISAIGTQIAANATSATSSAVTINANGTTTLTFGPSGQPWSAAAFDISEISAGELVIIDDNGTIDDASTTYVIATENGGTASTTLEVVGEPGRYIQEGFLVYRDPTFADSAAAANIIAYNDADTGDEIDAYLDQILNASSTYSSLLYNVYGGSGYYSVEIRDYGDDWTNNVADDLKLGLRYGGTETLGARAGANANIAAGKVYLYDGDTLVATTPIDAGGDGTTTNQVTFNLSSDNYVKITKNSSKTLTLKAEISDYVGAIEGSFIQFAMGTTTATEYHVYYVEAKGSQSQADLDFNTIADAGSATSGTQYISNAMYIYATKPTVTLNSASPSGTQTINSNGEVFRFDVANANNGHTLTINAIRFTIDSSTSTPAWDKTYNLYNNSDPSTVIGTGVSWALATSSGADTSGWVTIYPLSGYTLASAGTATYILKADTREMSVQNPNDRLTISIQSDNFLFSDGQAANAQKKVLNLPVNGNTLTY